jgi:hypothetical protein
MAVAMNARRLVMIGDRLRTHFRGGGGTVLEPPDLAHLVYAFARYAAQGFPASPPPSLPPLLVIVRVYGRLPRPFRGR